MITENEYNELIYKYNYALNILETNLTILLKEYERVNNYIVIDHIKSRIKKYNSTIKKLEKKGYDLTIDNVEKHVHDIVGLRIVCPFLSDVYKVVELIKGSNLFKIKEEKDYIENPKDTGYMSYHIIVEVHVPTNNEIVQAEIQVRTMAMDFWASIDHRLQYKFETETPDKIKQELYKNAIKIKNIDNNMLELKEFIDKQ